MEIVLHIEGKEFTNFKEKLLRDEIVNRASIVFKDAKQFGKDSGYFCILSGTEDRCKRAIELTKDKDGNELAVEVADKEKEEILKKVKEEENKAIEGFGGIFG